MYLNLSLRDRSRFVYRIMGLERLFQMFNESVNYLVRPIMWQDPFENFISHLKGKLPSGELVEFAQRYDFYGQCWTLLGGTDAMWRIYSKDRRSVRVKVRITDLYDSLTEKSRGTPFIGRVKYLHEADLHTWTRRVVRSTKSPSLELLAKTFLVKRIAFAHENEVRLLYCGTQSENEVRPLDCNTQGETHQLYRHCLDCHRIIKEIMLDPRLTREEFAQLSAQVRLRTSFKGPIVQSSLYVPPEDFVLRLGPSYEALPRSRRRVWYEGDRRISLTREDVIPQIILPVNVRGNGS